LTRKVGNAENNYLFAGEQFDEAVDGYYLRARYYDPNTGRFASVDPFEGFNNQPITLHDYLYAGVNPVNAIDPSGEVTFLEYKVLYTIFATGFVIGVGTCGGALPPGLQFLPLILGLRNILFTIGFYLGKFIVC
ncbi:MAG: RHS repeat-associated core domain-containing protein, partial [Microcystis panniformis]